MLDTDTVSFALRGVGEVGVRLAKHKRSELCLSAITVAELRFGADKRRSRKINNERHFSKVRGLTMVNWAV
ncbi:MAG: type II toxin-antitoxin system VapC family toxin [Polyangiaceae bacterium]|nr:type II toxin-antitoxin system VapC family toxin [Polyangiaceae bacterium]